MTPDTLISVGRIVRSRGLNGEVVVYPLSDDPERLRSFERVITTSEDGIESERTLVSARIHHRKGRTEVHARFEGVDSRTGADELRGHLISIPEDELELGEDEYFLFDLVGLEAATADGVLLGSVVDVERYPGQDLIVVEDADGRRSLIPDVPAFIDKSKLDDGRIIVTPIDGLLEAT
jgi:16S rRNA processing protein RimM